MKDFLSDCVWYRKSCCKCLKSLLKITWDQRSINCYINRLLNNAVKWPNMLKWSSDSQPARFLKYICPFFNTMRKLIYYPELSERWYIEIRFTKQLILYLVIDLWYTEIWYSCIQRDSHHVISPSYRGIFSPEKNLNIF